MNPVATSAPAITHYDSVAAAYNSDEHLWFYKEIAARLCAAIPEALSPRRILEIGCGSGFSTSALIDAFPSANITAVEPAAEMAKRALLRCGERLRVVSSLDELGAESAGGVGNDFDLVFSSMTFHWLPEETRRRLSALVAPTGALAIATPARLSGARATGNHLLISCVQAMRRRFPDFELPPTARGIRMEDLRRIYFNHPELHAETVLADSPCAPIDFAKTLEVRGALLALFGDKTIAAEAKVFLKRRVLQLAVPAGERIETMWPVNLWVAGASS